MIVSQLSINSIQFFSVFGFRISNSFLSIRHQVTYASLLCFADVFIFYSEWEWRALHSSLIFTHNFASLAFTTPNVRPRERQRGRLTEKINNKITYNRSLFIFIVFLVGIVWLRFAHTSGYWNWFTHLSALYTYRSKFVFKCLENCHFFTVIFFRNKKTKAIALTHCLLNTRRTYSKHEIAHRHKFELLCYSYQPEIIELYTSFV